MHKDYKKWLELKSKINDIKLPESFHVDIGEIWWCSFGENIDIEIDGKGLDYSRPALIVKFFNKYHIWVVPVTNSPSKNEFHVNIKSFSNTSTVTISQLHTISTKRLLKFIAKISPDDFEIINKSLINLLQKENPTDVG